MIAEAAHTVTHIITTVPTLVPVTNTTEATSQSHTFGWVTTFLSAGALIAAAVIGYYGKKRANSIAQQQVSNENLLRDIRDAIRESGEEMRAQLEQFFRDFFRGDRRHP